MSILGTRGLHGHGHRELQRAPGSWHRTEPTLAPLLAGQLLATRPLSTSLGQDLSWDAGILVRVGVLVHVGVPVPGCWGSTPRLDAARLAPSPRRAPLRGTT